MSEKGLPLILQAAQKLQAAGYNFRIKFVGDGPEREKLQAQAVQLGIKERVEFTGFLTGDLLQTLLAAVTAVPVDLGGTAGLAAIEQMMRGRLVIASNIGGLGEVVDDCGLRFPMGDLEGLTACMRTVLEHPEIVEQMGLPQNRKAIFLCREW